MLLVVVPLLLAWAAAGGAAAVRVGTEQHPLSASKAVDDFFPRKNPFVDVLDYDFAITITDQSNKISGRAVVTFALLADNVSSLVLDLDSVAMNVSAVVDAATGAPLQRSHSGGLLTISGIGSVGAVTIDYEGVPSDGLIIETNKYGDRTFFGDNWPARASFYLPCADHVSDKATVTWRITHPSHYLVVANGLLLSRDNNHSSNPAVSHTVYRQSVPIPPKVTVFGAAAFAVDTDEDSFVVPLQSWVYPQDEEIGFRDFALCSDIVNWFAAMIGPFPYEKLANVQSKTIYGGMENAAAIFYAEGRVTGDGSIESLIAHEASHQWWGDSVTEREWSSIWLSEGFATYFASLWMEHKEGFARMVSDMTAARQRVLDYYAARPASTVVDETYAELVELYNAYTYQKGAYVLQMLRRLLDDDDVFWRCFQEFYSRHRDGTAVSADFIAVVEEVSGRTLTTFFSQWLTRPGHPRIAVTVDRAVGEAVMVTIEQNQPEDPFEFELDFVLANAAEQQQLVQHIDVRPLRRTTVRVPLTIANDDGSVYVSLIDPHAFLLFDMDQKQ